MIISRTPFRISFFGGGTDFPEFYERHGGSTLLTTINKYCYLSIHELSPFFKHRFRASYSTTELVQTPSEFKHPLIRECLGYLNVDRPLEITHIADLPGQTGLGSSSSFTVGLLNALHTFIGNQAGAEQLAREAIHVERERVGDAGGHQDQYAAAYGGFVRLEFMGRNDIRVKGISLSPTRLKEIENHLLIFYLGTETSAASISQEQQRRIKQNTRALSEMLAMVDEAERILCDGQTLNAFGDLLHESWQRKKSLSPGITNPNVDQAYESARRAGARGGKLLGAGGRGFLLLYANPGSHAQVRQSLKTLREISFLFSAQGSHIIFQTPE